MNSSIKEGSSCIRSHELVPLSYIHAARARLLGGPHLEWVSIARRCGYRGPLQGVLMIRLEQTGILHEICIAGYIVQWWIGYVLRLGRKRNPSPRKPQSLRTDLPRRAVAPWEKDNEADTAVMYCCDTTPLPLDLKLSRFRSRNIQVSCSGSLCISPSHIH